MSSSYSSLYWVFSRWAHFTVRKCICVYVCVFCSFYERHVLYYCNIPVVMVELMGLKPNPWDPIFLQCFDIVGWVACVTVKTRLRYDL